MTSNSLSKEQVLARAETLDFPSSVVEFFQGYLGQPVGGFPEPFRTKIIRNKPRIDSRPGATMAPLDFRKIKAELRAKFGRHITDADVTSYVMYPKVCRFEPLGRPNCFQPIPRSSRSIKDSSPSMAT
jgi:pyruvate carboxylase